MPSFWSSLAKQAPKVDLMLNSLINGHVQPSLTAF